MIQDIVFKGILVPAAEITIGSYYVDIIDDPQRIYRIAATYHMYSGENHLESRDIRYDETAQDAITLTKIYARISTLLQDELDALTPLEVVE